MLLSCARLVDGNEGVRSRDEEASS
jgi:nucleotide-binding universal stress UspA family protein